MTETLFTIAGNAPCSLSQYETVRNEEGGLVLVQVSAVIVVADAETDFRHHAVLPVSFQVDTALTVHIASVVPAADRVADDEARLHVYHREDAECVIAYLSAKRRKVVVGLDTLYLCQGDGVFHPRPYRQLGCKVISRRDVGRDDLVVLAGKSQVSAQRHGKPGGLCMTERREYCQQCENKCLLLSHNNISFKWFRCLFLQPQSILPARPSHGHRRPYWHRRQGYTRIPDTKSDRLFNTSTIKFIEKHTI